MPAMICQRCDGAGANDIANTGEGDDAVILAGTAAGFTANTGDDNDTITFDTGATDVIINAGDGTDTVVLANDTYQISPLTVLRWLRSMEARIP